MLDLVPGSLYRCYEQMFDRAMWEVERPRVKLSVRLLRALVPPR
jgi:hypothetical protein